MGVGHTEHAPALHRREGAQRDPVGEVALQLVHAPLVQPLGGQQQVYAQASAEAADHDEQLHEVPVGGEQLAELVHDHEERGHGLHGRVAPAALLVLVHRAEVARRTQQLLAADELTVQGVLHALHEGGLVGQVGDQRRGVGQPVQTDERGAALEVHQDEVEPLRGVGERQGQHERAQQFALARTGGADQHSVRAHAAQGRLLEVQLQGGARGRDADGHPQPALRTLALPLAGGVPGVQVRDAQQGGEIEVRGQWFHHVGGDAHPVWGHHPGQGTGPVQVQSIGASQM